MPFLRAYRLSQAEIEYTLTKIARSHDLAMGGFSLELIIFLSSHRKKFEQYRDSDEIDSREKIGTGLFESLNKKFYDLKKELQHKANK